MYRNSFDCAKIKGDEGTGVAVVFLHMYVVMCNDKLCKYFWRVCSFWIVKLLYHLGEKGFENLQRENGSLVQKVAPYTL